MQKTHTRKKLKILTMENWLENELSSEISLYIYIKIKNKLKTLHILLESTCVDNNLNIRISIPIEFIFIYIDGIEKKANNQHTKERNFF